MRSGPFSGRVLLPLALVVLSSGAKLGEAQTCADIPASVAEVIHSRFPGWHVVGIEDLVTDHQQLWKAQHDNACPGLVAGHFDSRTNASHVALLMKQEGKRLFETVVQIVSQGSRPRVRTLNRPAETVSGSVLVVMPPGEYEEAEGDRKVRTKYDGVIYDHLEAGGILFYWTGRSFARLTVSE